MVDNKIAGIVEALLFVAERPLKIRDIQEVLNENKMNVAPEKISAVFAHLKEEYTNTGRSFQIFDLAFGYQLKSLPEYAPYVTTLLKDQLRERLSIPSLETLAIIAYKQPVTRAEVEAIRGVNVDGITQSLLEKDLIQVVGKKDVPGKPSLLGTTKQFLLHFGLNDLADLPNMEEFKEALVSRERQLEAEAAASQQTDPEKSETTVANT